MVNSLLLSINFSQEIRNPDSDFAYLQSNDCSTAFRALSPILDQRNVGDDHNRDPRPKPAKIPCRDSLLVLPELTSTTDCISTFTFHFFIAIFFFSMSSFAMYVYAFSIFSMLKMA